MRPSTPILLALAAISGPLSAQQQEARGAGAVVLRAARLIDGTGAPAIANGVVVVTDDRIVAVGREGAVSVPAGARRIDLGDATLLPGFIDAHTHVIGRPLGDLAPTMPASATSRALARFWASPTPRRR